MTILSLPLNAPSLPAVFSVLVCLAPTKGYDDVDEPGMSSTKLLNDCCSRFFTGLMPTLAINNSFKSLNTVEFYTRINK